MEPRARIAPVWMGLLVALVLGLACLPSAGQDKGFERKRGQRMLDKVCREVEKKFYDPDLRGLDWKALCTQAHERIENANSVGEILTNIFAVVNQLQDSHTHFFPPQRAAAVLFGFEAKAFGDEIRIYEVKEKGAAAKAGLQVGDRLLRINGFNVERSSFDLLMIYMRALRPVADMEIVFSRRDEPPRTVRVEGKVKQGKILWDISGLTFDIWELLRELDIEEETFDTKNYEDGIGYLRLPHFTGRTFYKMFLKGKVDDIKKSRAVIIDLRGNPGGAVDSLTYLCSFFESEPTVIANMVGRKKSEPIKVKPRRPNLSGPLFILVDSQSASAAEIFARHFQRTGRAVVIGDTTSGRVNISRSYEYKVGMDVAIYYGLQVAMARAVLPDGEELEKRGVTPDKVCIPTEEDLREEHDPCKDMALVLARKALGTTEQEQKED